MISPGDGRGKGGSEGLTILHVEDEPTTRRMVSMLLEETGAKVVGASTGPEGLERFRALRPDIVLTDILMLGMDGLELARAIRAEDESVPIVVVTTFDDSRLLLEAIEIGVDRYLVKPIDRTKLLAAVARCVGTVRLDRAKRREEEAIRRLQLLEAVGKLAGGVAHNINNQMTVVQGYAAMLLQKEGACGNQRQALSAILKAGERSARMARRLLASGGMLALKPARLALDGFVAEILPSLRVAAGEGGPPELAAGEGPVEIVADPTKLEESLVILASCARPGDGPLRLRTGSTGAISPDEAARLGLVPGRYGTITLSSPGYLAFSASLPSPFIPFASSLDLDEGLALPSVLGFILQSNGAIELERPSGSSASITIYLPESDES